MDTSAKPRTSGTEPVSDLNLIRRSISIPSEIARQIDAIAAARRVSADHAIVGLLVDGIGAHEQRRKEFFALAERFQESADPIETEEFRGALARLTFGESPDPREVGHLGPLAELPGEWSGRGFRLTPRPDHSGSNDFFLDLHLTDEKVVFGEIDVFGFHYVRRIDEASTHETLHVEPGVWCTATEGSLARIARDHDGSWQLAEGTSLTVNGPPVFQAANTVPYPIGSPTPAPGAPNTFPEYSLGAPNAFRTNPVPAGITQGMVTNPASALATAIAGHIIEKTVVLNIGTSATIATTPPTVQTISDGGGSVGNTPILTTNANAATVLATFWIETVKHPSGHGRFLQLQYLQTVLLNFMGLSWPQVTVGTLVKR